MYPHALWGLAFVLTVTGLVAVLRRRLYGGAALIVTGLVLGLMSGSRLDS